MSPPEIIWSREKCKLDVPQGLILKPKQSVDFRFNLRSESRPEKQIAPAEPDNQPGKLYEKTGL
jgi:hypothetical protein